MEVKSGGGHKKGPGVKKGKKLSTRVDLTPMVDLGFLLITFFMFTTTLAKPKTMEINMPNTEKIEEKEQTKVKESVAFTVLLSKDHRIYYYEGLASDPTHPPDVKVTYFKPKGGIRDAIIDKKKRLEEQRQQDPTLTVKDQLTVLIKPDVNSTYEDLVNMLDEMAINDVKIYAIVDITQVDKEFIQSTEQANPAQ